MYVEEIGFCLVLRLDGMHLVGIWRQVGSMILLVTKLSFDALLFSFDGERRCFFGIVWWPFQKNKRAKVPGTRRVSAAVFEKYAFLACTCVVEES